METATKKTLADFKRDIGTGMTIECVQIQEVPWNSATGRHDGEPVMRGVGERMQGPRYVSYVDTTGFYLKRPNDVGARGSFCGYPKASELSYYGDEFTITERDQHGDVWQVRTYRINRFN